MFLALNRTILELKLYSKFRPDCFTETLNRTILELKLDSNIENNHIARSQSHHIGIETRSAK